MSRSSFDDDDITLDEWMDQTDKVLDAYAAEVGMIRQYLKSIDKRIANIESRVKVLEDNTEQLGYENVTSEEILG